MFQTLVLRLKIIESFGLEKTLKIIKSNQKLNIAKSTTKLCPRVPRLDFELITTHASSSAVQIPGTSSLTRSGKESKY